MNSSDQLFSFYPGPFATQNITGSSIDFILFDIWVLSLGICFGFRALSFLATPCSKLKTRGF
jgi:hypothetical protein